MRHAQICTRTGATTIMQMETWMHRDTNKDGTQRSSATRSLVYVYLDVLFKRFGVCLQICEYFFDVPKNEVQMLIKGLHQQTLHKCRNTCMWALTWSLPMSSLLFLHLIYTCSSSDSLTRSIGWTMETTEAHIMSRQPSSPSPDSFLQFFVLFYCTSSS